MKFIVGTKQNMTQVYGDDGKAYPATLLAVPPITVTQIKTTEKDGYTALQFGVGTAKDKNVHKAQEKKGKFISYKEVRLEEASTLALGDIVSVDTFVPGDVVTVVGTSKSKGFQGGVKRHGFHGGSRTHGQKHSEREVGSIGGGGRAGGRVVKGMRMAGRMGGDRVTVKNLTVLQVDAAGGYLLVSGAIPGRRGTMIEVRGIAS